MNAPQRVAAPGFADPRELGNQALEDAITALSASIAVATWRLLSLIAEYDRRRPWGDWCIKSTAHWLSWKCGVALGAARERSPDFTLNVSFELPEDMVRIFHDYEILSRQLVAPGIPQVAEQALMKGKMNSYGKTWHTWKAGKSTHAPDDLPLGPPLLAWSFNQDGEADPALVAARDERERIDTAEKRREREELKSLAKPQVGEDALRKQ